MSSNDQIEQKPKPLVPVKVLRRAWPGERLCLLIEAAIAPNDDRAAAAWQKWNTLATLDGATWSEVRLLSALAPRLKAIDPDYPNLGRLLGFRRYIFTMTSQILNHTLPMMRALRAADIEFMLIKGTARLVDNPRLAAERHISDIDILVRPEDWLTATEVAQSNNWWARRSKSAMADGTLAGQYSFRHSIDFFDKEPPTTGRLDVHHHARHMCRFPGDDDNFWTRSTPATFLGIPVRVPSPTDQALIMLTHALRRSRTASATGEWALDVAALISSGQIRWDDLVAEAKASKTQMPVAASLLFLVERCGLTLPAGILTKLRRNIDPAFVAELEFLARLGYGSFKVPKAAAGARDAAILRARSAIRRPQNRQAPRRTRSGFQRIPVDRHLAGGQSVVIALPPDIRPRDKLILEIRGRVVKNEASQILVRSPFLAIDRHHPPQLEKGERPKSFTFATTLDPAFLLMAKIGQVEVNLESELVVDRFDVRWYKPPLLTRLRRRARSLKGRIEKSLRARFSKAALVQPPSRPA